MVGWGKGNVDRDKDDNTGWIDRGSLTIHSTSTHFFPNQNVST